MTAAHCCTKFEMKRGKIRLSRKKLIKVVVGGILRSKKEPNEQTLNIDKLISHPKYGRKNEYNWDICIIKVKRSSFFSLFQKHFDLARL